MCPDRQLISLYVDGEIPSPWKEKLESHLKSCPSCEKIADGYRELSAALGSIPVQGLEEARSRVWNAVAHRASIERGRSAWRRSLVLPIPAAIAAVLVVAIIAAGGAGVAIGGRKPQAMAVIQQPQTPAVPVSDMSSVLRYLESQDSSGDILIIRLPESSNFVPDGKPTLVRAADYNGRPLP